MAGPSQPLEDIMLWQYKWWYNFRNFYGGDLASKQIVPMLIVQGDNDMQVSADNLEGWKQALDNGFHIL